MRAVEGTAVRAIGLVAFAVLAGSCSEPSADVTATVRLPPGVQFANVSADPATVVHSARLWPDGEIGVAMAPDARAVLRMQGICPVTLGASPQGTDGAAAAPADLGPVVEAKPWLDVGEDRAQVGFDTAFEIRAVGGCPEATQGRVEWRQLSGPALVDLRTEDNGFRLRARTQPLAAVHPDALAWGIVPFSPRTQGRYELEATWIGAAGPVHRTVTVTSIARATGVPSVAVGQRVVLGGTGWRVRTAARGGVAQVRDDGALATFEPDAPGAWLLVDRDERTMQVRAGWHDRTPLDCGRKECHANEAAASPTSPMTHALERQLSVSGGGCMLDCHVVGERGLHDGGFLDVAASLGWSWVGQPRWQEMPRALRRVGGVGCTGCHGPAAIPDPPSRDRILAVDVCATCHDAPPTYVHVEQWRMSRMARSDSAPETRTNRCARCHTTAGFLTAIGVRKSDADPRPFDPAGIGCAACHAPHGAHTGDALARAVPVPPTLGGQDEAARNPESTACIFCHSPQGEETLPSASAGALWMGRAPVTSVKATSPHAGVPRGCLGCHTDHTFRAQTASCSGCHKTPPDERRGPGGTVRERALALWAKLARRPLDESSRPLHASLSPDASPLDRAAYDVALVLEDPAAGVHNAPFARALLDEAESAQKKQGPGVTGR